MKIKFMLSQYYSFIRQFIIWKLLRKKIIISHRNCDNSVVIVPCDPENVGGSRGDEAMIVSSIDFYRKINPNVCIYIIVSSEKGEQYIKSLCYENILPIISWNGKYPLEKVYRSIIEKQPSEVVILGADCMDGFYSPYLSLMLLSTYDLLLSTGIKTHLLGFSFNEKPSKLMVIAFKSLSTNVPINLRDIESKKRYDIFVSKSSSLVADAAFLLEPDSNFNGFISLKKWLLSKNNKGDKTIIGFNFHPMLRHYKNEQDIKNDAIQIAMNLENCLYNHSNILFVLIPHDDRNRLSDNIVLATIYDYLITKKMKDRIYYDKNIYRASQIKSLCTLLDGLISSRMHLAIAALSLCIPVMAATYQGKFEGLYEHFGLNNNLLLKPEAFISNEFNYTFDYFLKNLDSINIVLKSNIEKVINLSKQNFL